MELVLIIGLFAIAVIGYVVSFFCLKKEAVKKLWLILFLVIFVISIIALLVIHFKGLLASVPEMSALYFFYFIIIALLVVGLINIWSLKVVIWRILTGKPLEFSDNEKDVKERN